jgi:hypothetical protein
MIVPVTRRVIKSQKVNLTRLVSDKETAKVSVGEAVSPEDVIGVAEIPSGRRLVKLASLLGVHGRREVEKHLVKPLGARVFEGEILARRKSFFGLKTNVFRSPIDGVISEVDGFGSLVIDFLPCQNRLVAGVGGKVLEVSGKGVVIETVVSKIKTKVGVGKEREGSIKIVAEPNEFLLPTKLDVSCRDKIIVGGASVGKETLEKALTIGVRGLVVGGINVRDFSKLGELDSGMTVLITEGFGIRPMAEDVYLELKKHHDGFGIINGSQRELIIPLSKEDKETNSEVPGGNWQELDLGLKVYLSGEAHGHVGILEKIEQNGQYGFNVPEALVRIDQSETLRVPACNLEIIRGE